eukprot:130720-Chlamydomonas_euryale.AAC.1
MMSGKVWTAEAVAVAVGQSCSGSEQVGSEEVGSEQVGYKQLGSEQVGSEQVNLPRHPPIPAHPSTRLVTTHLSTHPSNFSWACT